MPRYRSIFLLLLPLQPLWLTPTLAGDPPPGREAAPRLSDAADAGPRAYDPPTCTRVLNLLHARQQARMRFLEQQLNERQWFLDQMEELFALGEATSDQRQRARLAYHLALSEQQVWLDYDKLLQQFQRQVSWGESPAIGQPVLDLDAWQTHPGYHLTKSAELIEAERDWRAASAALAELGTTTVAPSVRQELTHRAHTAQAAWQLQTLLDCHVTTVTPDGQAPWPAEHGIPDEILRLTARFALCLLRATDTKELDVRRAELRLECLHRQLVPNEADHEDGIIDDAQWLNVLAACHTATDRLQDLEHMSSRSERMRNVLQNLIATLKNNDQELPADALSQSVLWGCPDFVSSYLTAQQQASASLALLQATRQHWKFALAQLKTRQELEKLGEASPAEVQQWQDAVSMAATEIELAEQQHRAAHLRLRQLQRYTALPYRAEQFFLATIPLWDVPERIAQTCRVSREPLAFLEAERWALQHQITRAAAVADQAAEDAKVLTELQWQLINTSRCEQAVRHDYQLAQADFKTLLNLLQYLHTGAQHQSDSEDSDSLDIFGLLQRPTLQAR